MMGHAACIALLLGLTPAPPVRPHEATPFIDPMFRVRVTRDIAYGTAVVGRSGAAEKSLHLDLYEPDADEAPRPRPGFVAVHGGSLGTADKSDANMVELCEELAARGFVCASINYRMGTDDPPTSGATLLDRVVDAAVRDAERAVLWLEEHKSGLGLDTARMAVGGSSSGAEVVLRLAYGNTRTVPLDRRPAGRSLYHHLADSLYRQLDLANVGRRAPQSMRSTARIDTLAVPCPR